MTVLADHGDRRDAGVEPIGRPFGILGWQPPAGNTSLTMCGRLVFQPVG